MNISVYATLVVAFIAGSFSLIGLVASKEQKVSEFRQAWIDALRIDVGDLIANANIIHAELLKLAEEQMPNKVEFLKRTRDNYLATNRATTKIVLRLNLSERESGELISAIRKLEELVTRDILTLSDTAKELNSINLEVELRASVVLKNEWERVKKGEKIFQIITRAAMVLIILSVIALGITVALAPIVSSGVNAMS